jgi:uncharacterized protein (TIGR02145 family)
MKKFYFTSLVLLLGMTFFSFVANAQAPQSMSYQTVIRNSSNVLLTNTLVGIKISVLQGSASGTAVYAETQTTTTNANGLASMMIGAGTTVTGIFAGINWANGPYFIKIETDPVGGNNYSITDTQQCQSVPYGLYGENGKKPGTNVGQMNYWNGTTWVPIVPAINNDATLYMINSVPTWAALPGAPTMGTATAGGGQATITYTAPANNGGAAITSYTATSTPGGFTGTVSQAGSGTITVTGLMQGTTYNFTVTATNAAGTSVASAVSNSVTTYTIPNAPIVGTATAGAGQATITYTAPASNGLGAIISYTATSSPGGLTGSVFQAGSGNIIVSGLTNGTSYTFTVTANNEAGTSIASAPSNSVTPISVPDAPTIENAEINIYSGVAGQAIIRFTAPANNGGEAITSYIATSSPGGLTGTWPYPESGYIFVTGLVTGTTYTFTVTATNAIGTSVASAPSNPVLELPSVVIDYRVWQSTNLDVSTYSDGTPIPQVTDPADWAALTTGAWCYYDNDLTNGITYGKLYNWYAIAGIYDAASSADPALRKKLAPSGWRVSTDADWYYLINFLGGQSGAGGKMKETGTSHWNNPNADATNSSGFTGLPGGLRAGDGSFQGMSDIGFWWSLREDGFTESRGLLTFTGDSVVNYGYYVDGYSVRCVRD